MYRLTETSSEELSLAAVERETKDVRVRASFGSTNELKTADRDICLKPAHF
jgi:hypothetical protein